MGNRFSSIAAGNKDTADRRPGPGPIGSTRPGPIRSTRSSKHRTSPYPHQSPKRAALERSGSLPSHAGTSHASSTSARVTRFRDDSPDTDSSNSDLGEGWDNPTTVSRPACQGSDNAAHDERNQNATPPSCASTPSAPMRNSGAPSYSGSHCYTTFHYMPILSSPKVMSLPLNLRPIPSLPRHLTSTHTSVHVQIQAQTTTLPTPRMSISRESSPDYESLNPNTQGQAAELEEFVEETRIDTVAAALEQARVEPSADFIARPGSQEWPNSNAMAAVREAGRASGAVSRVRNINERWTVPSDTTGPPKIPKPPGVAGRPGRGGYVLREALKLDDARYCAIRTKMNELVEAHLEPAPYGKQSKERLEAYTKEAVKILPVLDEYENQWPAHDFAAAHLNYWREKLKRIERQRAMALVESGELELESEEEDGWS